MSPNLLAALGIIMIVVAVTALAGVWWAVLFAGCVLVGLAWVNHEWEQRETTALQHADEQARR